MWFDLTQVRSPCLCITHHTRSIVLLMISNGNMFARMKFDVAQAFPLACSSHQPSMSVSQSALRDVWRGGQDDRMCAMDIAKAWALREASRELHAGKDKLPWVAARVVKNDGTHPSREALRQLFQTIDSDPDWFPGKHSGTKRGPPPVFTAAKRRRCASAMMRLKHEEGDEPSLEEMKQRCPKAVINPETGLPFTDKILRRVLTEDCCDLDPEHPWRFQARLQKRFASDTHTCAWRHAQKAWAQHSPFPRIILAERMHTCVSHGFGDASGIPRLNLTLLS